MQRLLCTFLVAASFPLFGQTKNSLPSVSPDGSLIAFVSDSGGQTSLRTIHPDGTGEQTVMRGNPQRPFWTADSHILFAGSGDEAGKLFMTGRGVVATIAGRSAVLSPDGAHLLYLTGPWTSTAMFVAKADGSEARQIAGGSTTAWNGVWSPDSKRIAYTYGDASKVLQVHVINVDGSGDHAVTSMPAAEGSAQMPAWSPDGRRLAVQVSNGQTHTAHVWIVDLATGEARKLAPHKEAYLDEVPSWFPDGKRIAFQSNRSGTMEIWIMRDDGSGARQVTNSR